LSASGRLVRLWQIPGVLHHSIIRGIAKDGIGIILISSELPEIIALSHSVVVMHEGKITGIFKKSEVNQDKLMAYATGILDDFK